MFLRRFKYSIKDLLVSKTVVEIRLDILVLRDCREQISDLVDKCMLPTDDVPRGPPRIDKRMRRLGDHDIAKTLFVSLISSGTEFEFVETFKVENETALAAKELEPQEVLAAGREPGSHK